MFLLIVIIMFSTSARLQMHSTHVLVASRPCGRLIVEFVI